MCEAISDPNVPLSPESRLDHALPTAAQKYCAQVRGAGGQCHWVDGRSCTTRVVHFESTILVDFDRPLTTTPAGATVLLGARIVAAVVVGSGALLGLSWVAKTEGSKFID